MRSETSSAEQDAREFREHVPRTAMPRTARDAIKAILGEDRVALVRRFKWSLMCHWNGWGVVKKPMDPRGLETLCDPAFKSSMEEVRDVSSLDTARLANLWEWCALSEPGAIVEVGAFRGGTALHLSNRWPERKVFACDTFEGFQRLSFTATDSISFRGSWCNPDAAAVAALFDAHGRDAVVLKGIFPQSDEKGEIVDVSFAHIDVDIYASCHASLEYLAARATPWALFAVNDYLREGTRGIARAVEEFLAVHPDWRVIPVFPGQALMLRRPLRSTKVCR